MNRGAIITLSHPGREGMSLVDTIRTTACVAKIPDGLGRSSACYRTSRLILVCFRASGLLPDAVMSVITQCFSFLAIKPRVWIDGDRLYARASLVTRIVSLGAYDRCVVVDRRERLISIHKKDCWSWRSAEKIPLDRVVEIDRSLDRWTTKRCPDDYMYNRWSRTDQLEFFKVSLARLPTPGISGNC